MVICNCYHDDINWLNQRGVCWGTKECEPCSCKGNELKCDFYPEVIEKAKVREEFKKATKDVITRESAKNAACSICTNNDVCKELKNFKSSMCTTMRVFDAIESPLSGKKKDSRTTHYDEVVSKNVKELAFFIIEREKVIFDCIASKFSNHDEFSKMLEPDWYKLLQDMIDYLKEEVR